MANDIYGYNQTATSNQMAAGKTDDLRAQLAAIQANSNMASFATNKVGTRDNNGSQEFYNLSDAELAQQGQLNRDKQVYDLNQQIANPFGQNNMESDYYSGVKKGEQILGPNGLGRIGSDTQVQDVLNRSNQLATQGYDSSVLEAQRQQMNQNINQNTQSTARSLAGQLARSGVKGGVAGNQMAGVYMGANAQKNNVNRDIFIKNADFMNQNLNTYGKALGDVKSFDLGQVAKEKNIIMQSGLGFQQIGSTERSAAKQAEASAQAQAASSGGKVICTELYRQGLMSKDLYRKDQRFGAMLSILDPELMHGYHILAEPVVKLMKKSKFFTMFIIRPVVMPWALYMSGQNNKLGAIIHYVGSFICRNAFKFSRNSYALSR
jgi:hypothetical protein